jgi:hypothetical protein
MKRISLTLLALLAILSTTGAAPVAVAAASDNFVAVLSGDNEVPPRDTHARGVATFKTNKDGNLDYKLIAANIENVVFAHIHCNVAGANGPIGATLLHADMAPGPGSGQFNGVLATGTISAPDSPNGCGWTTVADIKAAINSGGAYVNVHTNDGINPPNTGPGDFPGGEIRGQVR